MIKSAQPCAGLACLLVEASAGTRGMALVSIIDMRSRNRQLRAIVEKAYAAAIPEVRTEVDRIVASLGASARDENKALEEIYGNLRARAKALIAGGAEPTLFADYL